MIANLDLREGDEYNKAVETIALVLSGVVPTAEAARDAVEAQYEQALETVYPIDES
jgi:hypothetical protein